MRGALSGLCLLGVLAAMTAHGQVAGYGEKSMGDPAQDHLPDFLQKVRIDQRLNQQLPLQAPFVDSAGKPVKLGDYFGKRPVILALVYYQCQILCSEELNGLVGALEMVHLTPGKDFEIVVASIDPSEGPALARAKKAVYVKRYGRMETANGWHFLTGPESSIQALTQAVGFGYMRVAGPDGKLNQFAHTSSLEIVTPEGRLAQYYMGVEYSPKDLMLGLVEASHHKIGTPVDNIMTYCYRYDPKLNRHSLVVARIVQLGCLLTMIGLGSFMVVNFRRDITQAGKG
ncbi:MAG TPA: SCO family protein [Acidobacteriaceae bacterium]|nr:SCO family protein [Acidobacteriaceae bacterium]